MTQIYTRYPRGYLSAISNIPQGPNDPQDIKIIDVSTDPALALLYKIRKTRAVNWDSWGMQKQAIIACCKLFGNLKQWLELQYVSNDCCYGLNLEFLEDTVRFINTGERKMSLNTWYELLLEYPTPQAGTADGVGFNLLPLDAIVEDHNPVSRWCSHVGGFEDMLHTAHILFGETKPV